ncbi:hypothetical protein F183_A27290 [Bryobacterales bacterium F-183]|nr:hypothetical protein F183_A27290 [Bryobacterales bacterium F-183]
MKLLPLIAALALTASAQNLEKYCNAKYAYCVSYPATLLEPQGEPDAADGQKFISKDKSIVLTVWGSLNALDEKLPAAYESTVAAFEKEGAKVTYKLLRPPWFVASGTTAKGQIFYRKTFLVDNTFKTLLLTYPASRKTELDQLVGKVVTSFR